jgi:hypothetical protein
MIGNSFPGNVVSHVAFSILYTLTPILRLEPHGIADGVVTKVRRLLAWRATKRNRVWPSTSGLGQTQVRQQASLKSLFSLSELLFSHFMHS